MGNVRETGQAMGGARGLDRLRGTWDTTRKQVETRIGELEEKARHTPSSPHPLISPTVPTKLQHADISRCTHTLALTLPIHFTHIPAYHPKTI